jgi:hypothetical protein
VISSVLASVMGLEPSAFGFTRILHS